MLGWLLPSWRTIVTVALVIAFGAFCTVMSIRDSRREKDAAAIAGYEAGRLGQPPQACPYSEGWGGRPDMRAWWLESWAKGDAERRQSP